MKVEFVCHGVPQGHDTWGTGDSGYYQSFYGNTDIYKGVSSALVVEVRNNARDCGSYYTYIRPKNIIADGGRSGSYFAMTLRFDGQICSDVFSLYQLLSQVYSHKIVDKLLVVSGETERFQIQKFESEDFYLKELRNIVIGQVESNFANDLSDIDSSYTKSNSNKNVYYSVSDTNSESFFNATRVFGKVIVSDEYQDKDTTISILSKDNGALRATISDLDETVHKLKEDNQSLPKLREQVMHLQTVLSDAQKEYDEMSHKLSEFSSIIESLESKNKEYSAIIDKIKGSTDLNAIKNQLEAPLMSLLAVFQSSQNPSFPTNGKMDSSSVEKYSKSIINRMEQHDKRMMYYCIAIAVLTLISIMAVFV